MEASFILSSAGLRNVVFTKDYANSIEDTFKFIFQKKEIKMNRLFADFISPRVSHFHSIDPTIKSIDFDEFDINSILGSSQNSNELLFTDDMIELFQKLSNGYEIEINEKLSHKIRILAILLGNDEIYNKINSLFPNYISKDNIDSCIQYLQFLYKIPNAFDDEKVLEFIANNFYSIDRNKLLALPKPVLYSMLSNDKLKIENEDSLYSFIHQIFSNNNNDENNVNIVQFYELVDFSSLSQKNFADFLEKFDPTSMSTLLWDRLKKCFYSITGKPDKSSLKDILVRHTTNVLKFEYDPNTNNRFNGIIHHLTTKYGGNVQDKGIVDVTSTQLNSYSQLPKYVVDLDNIKSYFCSANIRDSWLCYDFKERKVRPTHYSIRSTHDYAKGYHHLKNWCIEGSNDNMEWKILDVRNEESSLDDRSASNTFKIQSALEENEYYRYLRIRETGVNTYGQFNLIFAGLEYFGSVREPIENSEN